MKNLYLFALLVLLTSVANASDIKVSELRASVNPVSSGEHFLFTAVITNTGDKEVDETIALLFESAPNGFYGYDPNLWFEHQVNLAPGASENLVEDTSIRGEDERFLVYFVDAKGNLLSDKYLLQLGECGVEVVKVEIPMVSYELYPGMSNRVFVAIYPGSAPQTATWTTSDENVVAIEGLEENGIWCCFKALSPGTVLLTATAVNGMTASVEVIVHPEPIRPESVKLDIHSFTGAVGDEVQLNVSVMPEDADPTVLFHSRNSAVAEVSESGLVTIKGEGEAVILAYAAWGSAQDVCIVNGTAGIQGVHEDAAATAGDVYGIDGRIVMRNATSEDVNRLDKGIYIYQGRKIIIK